MNEMYSEVREHLRRQHSCNTQEIQGKNSGYFYKSGNDKNDVQEDMKKSTSWTFSFKGKVFVFITAVLLFSCYLYGGKDVKKGAVMAFHEMSEQVTVLSDERPFMKQTVEDIKTIYRDAKDFFKTYFNVD